MTDVHLVEDTTDTIRFEIPFRSEDAGHALKAIFILDMDPSEDGAYNKIKGVQPVSMSTKSFQEQTLRSVQWDWPLVTNRPTPGCHSMTLLLTYADNTLDNYHVFDNSLAAVETWWFNFDGGQSLLEDCPPNAGGM